MLPTTSDVAVIGAGPAGLTTVVALEPAAQDVTVVDDQGQGDNTSRAGVHPHALETLEPHGVTAKRPACNTVFGPQGRVPEFRRRLAFGSPASCTAEPASSPDNHHRTENAMRIVNKHLNPATAPLLAPSETGYLLLAAEIDRRPMFLPGSANQRRLIGDAKTLAAELDSSDDVLRATVFRGFAHLVFGENHRLLRRAESAGFERARYDVVVLIETSTPDAAVKLRQDPGYVRLAERVGAGARRTFEIAASSPRNMGDVDFTRQGVFLFNFFYGEDERELIPVWEYTAGWWNVHTGLDNSRVLAPVDSERRDYGIVNHCRWDRLRDVAPKMIFRPSFRRFVLANFAANRISAQPTLYRLA